MGTNRERKDPVDGKYKKLMNNTMLFAISNFSSKLLSIVLQPYITFAMGEVEEVGITKLVQNIGSLLIPLVSMGVSFAIIRFGLEKQNSKSQVFTNGLVTILLGFGLMLAFYPLLRLIPLFNTYALLLYVHVLVSCLRTLCTQFVRSRQINRLVALDGVLCSATNLGFMLLFLSGLHLGAEGYVLALICSDALSALFVFVIAGLRRYLRFASFNLPLWKKMMGYALPMVPAQISFWIINASDLFFVKVMCNGYEGQAGEYWTGLLGVGYFLPTILTVLGTIFYEGTPLHDGAVVVRDGVLKAAGCVLPLSDNLEIGKDMGTRHRAALGMSENSDAVVVVVSEETGIISMAKNGVLIRRLDRQNLFNLLQEELVPPETAENQKQPFWRKKHEKEQQRQ